MTDFHIFQKISPEAYVTLLDASFKYLFEKLQSLDSFSQYKKICSTLGIEFSKLEPSLQLLLQLIQDAAKQNKSMAQLQNELLNLGMSENQVDGFSKHWEKVHSSLMAAETIPINPLIDMEWKFGVSSASSQFNTIGNVFLQMKLEVDQGNGRAKTVCFEFQLSEFYAFLHEMERARASLDYLTD